jgi:AcrR family transcriptional regulator
VTDRREQLLDAADAVVGRQGPAASMTAIAAEAGITKPILYRWFGDKGGLYRALAERHTEALLATIRAALLAPGDLQERTRRSIGAYLELIETNPQIYRFLTSGEPAAEPGVRSHVATTIDRLAEELAHGVAIELGQPMPPSVTAVIWARGILGMVQAAGDWWLDHPAAATRGQVAEELTALLNGAFPQLCTQSRQRRRLRRSPAAKVS